MEENIEVKVPQSKINELVAKIEEMQKEGISQEKQEKFKIEFMRECFKFVIEYADELNTHNRYFIIRKGIDGLKKLFEEGKTIVEDYEAYMKGYIKDFISQQLETEEQRTKVDDLRDELDVISIMCNDFLFGKDNSKYYELLGLKKDDIVPRIKKAVGDLEEAKEEELKKKRKAEKQITNVKQIFERDTFEKFIKSEDRTFFIYGFEDEDRDRVCFRFSYNGENSTFNEIDKDKVSQEEYIEVIRKILSLFSDDLSYIDDAETSKIIDATSPDEVIVRENISPNNNITNSIGWKSFTRGGRLNELNIIDNENQLTISLELLTPDTLAQIKQDIVNRQEKGKIKERQYILNPIIQNK